MDEGDLILLGAVSVIGALTGLGLSFTALSPLVIGGIIAAIPVILLTAYFICDSVKEGKFSKEALFFFACICVAIGVGLAAAATAIFPGAMLGMGSAALAGATIGVIAPIAGLFATMAIIFAAEKVNEYIISPIVECFSSKEKGYESL
ncbi:hypothetical protein [Wolbachia endosymbiont (group A) of Cheilosia soror]|uniref:hypothetical protein n=1 Tax=Wolbachia endosymbiont (group A) of Cheilosia soror TaxID=2953995 RepID=UPI0021F8A345|nr:hypothetical protein [Wolbachia endosymbiont (group A) of Cheilosia soror]